MSLLRRVRVLLFMDCVQHFRKSDHEDVLVLVQVLFFGNAATMSFTKSDGLLYTRCKLKRTQSAGKRGRHCFRKIWFSSAVSIGSGASSATTPPRGPAKTSALLSLVKAHSVQANNTYAKLQNNKYVTRKRICDNRAIYNLQTNIYIYIYICYMTRYTYSQ